MIAAVHPSAALAPAAGQPTSREQAFELRCCDVHPLQCDVRLSAPDPLELCRLAREHGGLAHGFTPAWYSAERIAAIAAAVTPPVC